jgi:hypothetical protein
MSVCDNQDKFNDAVYNAVEYTNKRQVESVQKGVVFYMLLHVMFLFWAVMLALRHVNKDDRVVHLTLAVLFSPVYVLSYYISHRKN